MKRAFLWEEMTREALNAVAPQALAVLPVGAVEQHGPHLPVGTDSFTVEYLARAASDEASRSIPIVLAPTLRFGSSHHHIPFGGTLSLSTETYYRVLCDLGESFILAGFKRLFVLNGHGGNNELIQVAARDLALKHSVSIAAAAYWTIAWDDLVAETAHEHGLLPGHAGIFETSQMMALRPELVEESRPHRDSVEKSDPRSFFDAYRVETHGAWQAIDGYSDSPDQARSQLGKTWLAAGVRSIARAFLEFHAGAV
jgi:creatinine amidohydrolase